MQIQYRMLLTAHHVHLVKHKEHQKLITARTAQPVHIPLVMQVQHAQTALQTHIQVQQARHLATHVMQHNIQIQGRLSVHRVLRVRLLHLVLGAMPVQLGPFPVHQVRCLVTHVHLELIQLVELPVARLAHKGHGKMHTVHRVAICVQQEHRILIQEEQELTRVFPVVVNILIVIIQAVQFVAHVLLPWKGYTPILRTWEIQCAPILRVAVVEEGTQYNIRT